jgi:hypothetical protein
MIEYLKYLENITERLALWPVYKRLTLSDHFFEGFECVVLDFQIPSRVVRGVVLDEVNVLTGNAQSCRNLLDYLVDPLGDFELLLLVIDNTIGKLLPELAFDNVDFGYDDKGMLIA